MTIADEGLIGLDPTTKPPEARGDHRRAPRAASLDGAIVGLISNTKGRATHLLEAVYEELATLTKLGGKVLVVKSSVYAVPAPADWSRVTAQATVGITGFGG